MLADRQPFSKFAAELFDFAARKQVMLYTSSHSMATAYYLLKQSGDEKELRNTLLSLMDLVSIIKIDAHMIRKSLSSKHKDLEDAIQIFAAQSLASMNYIVTRNIRDFRDAGIRVVGPHEIVGSLREGNGH